MNNFKRFNVTAKNANNTRYCGKPKDVKPGNLRKTIDSSPESECRISFPVVRSVDTGRILPRYAAVLSRSVDDGVGMEDLDRLQQDLEKLLSTTAVRHRLLKLEIESVDHQEERRKNKKSQLHDKQQSSTKRKRTDDKGKYKDNKNVIRPLKVRNTPIGNFVNESSVLREVPKVTFPKNDTFDKFWLSIEPYCTRVNNDAVAYLDDLIQECSQDIDTKISEVGEHYAMEWSDELLGHEQFLNNAQRSAKNKNINFTNELKQNGLNAMVETFSSPLTQRLLAALLEEKVVTKLPSVTDKLKPSDFGVFKTNFTKSGICMDRRLKKELVDQGILEVEDLSMTIPPDDDILMEIKRCTEELRAINDKNISELNKLRTIVAKDLRRQEIKEALDKVDNQVLELYNKIVSTKQNDLSDDESHCKLASVKSLDEYEEEANKVVHQQIILQKELTELTNSVIPL